MVKKYKKTNENKNRRIFRGIDNNRRIIRQLFNYRPNKKSKPEKKEKNNSEEMLQQFQEKFSHPNILLYEEPLLNNENATEGNNLPNIQNEAVPQDINSNHVEDENKKSNNFEEISQFDFINSDIGNDPPNQNTENDNDDKFNPDIFDDLCDNIHTNQKQSFYPEPSLENLNAHNGSVDRQNERRREDMFGLTRNATPGYRHY